MLGLMQNWPLLCHRIIDHAAAIHGKQEVVTRSVEGPIHRTNYAEIRARALKVGQQLDRQAQAVGTKGPELTYDGGAVAFPAPEKFARTIAFNVLPLAGTVVLTALPELVAPLAKLGNLFYGLLLLAVVLLVPEGIGRIFEWLVERLRPRHTSHALVEPDAARLAEYRIALGEVTVPPKGSLRRGANIGQMRRQKQIGLQRFEVMPRLAPSGKAAARNGQAIVLARLHHAQAADGVVAAQNHHLHALLAVAIKAQQLLHQ